jgi:hypothetical protein
MTSLTTWLLAMVQPLIARILVVLGLSVVTMGGTTVAMQAFVDHVQAQWSGIPAALLSLLHLAGIAQALTVIGSAIATRLFLLSLRASSAFLARTPG